MNLDAETIITTVVFGIPTVLTVLGIAYMIHEKR